MIEVGRDGGLGCHRRDGVSGRGGLLIVVQGFLVGLPFVSVIHYGFFIAESCGLEELELTGHDRCRRSMVNDLL